MPPSSAEAAPTGPSAPGGAALGVTVDDVRQAAGAIRGAVARTAQARSRTLSEITGAELSVKFENRQFTASFKERGALNKLLSLDAAQRAGGVIAMSAGNHAQGVAYHAQRLGVPATIVMPRATPFNKVRHTEAFGATVVLEGDTLAEAGEHAARLAAERGLVFVHPYDDARIIAGQGTVALEMLEDDPDLEMLVVPVGGGGLIAGMAVAAKAIDPRIRLIGVESALYPSMARWLQGEPAACGGDTIAEGIAVARVGALTGPIIRALVDEVLLVDEPTLERAIGLFLDVEKTVAEGAGAAGLAALLAYPGRFRGRRVGTPLCGGNIDPRLLATVILRNLFRDGTLANLRIPIPDAPGNLGRIAALVGDNGGNIVEVAHKRTFAHVPAKRATLDIVVEARDPSFMPRIVEAIRAAGYAVRQVEEDA